MIIYGPRAGVVVVWLELPAPAELRATPMPAALQQHREHSKPEPTPEIRTSQIPEIRQPTAVSRRVRVSSVVAVTVGP